MSATDVDGSGIANLNPFRYRGYVYDTETGWYYLQSRYYDPELGRFISSDVYLSTGQGIIGHNAYAYCLNNPVNRVDEDGRWPLPFDKRRQQTDGKSAENGGGGGGSSSVSSSQSGTNDVPNCPDVTIPGGFETGSSTQIENERTTFLPDEFYLNKAPEYSTPYNKFDHYMFKERTGKFERSRVIYDYAGRRSIRIDYANHGRRDHGDIHVHIYLYGNATIHGKEFRID